MSIELLNKCYELDIALKENQKLQSNWNSLREWVFEHIDSVEFNSYDDVLDKMNELESGDKE